MRYDGDDFVYAMPGLGPPEVRTRLRAVRATLAEGPLTVRVTFGIAERHRGESIDSLSRRADPDLYEIRRKGRAR